MKTIRETVDLPDAAKQPLVHPLDLVDSRKPFIVSWWLAIVAMPTVTFLLAAVLWVVSNNYITPILVPVSIAVGSSLLGDVLQKEAWAYIPRRRQDVARPVPALWLMLRDAISTASLLAGLVLLTLWVVDRGYGTGVIGYMLGTGAGIVVLMIAGILWSVTAPAPSSTLPGSRTTQIVRIVAVSGAVLMAYLIIDSRYDATELAMSDILTGAVFIIAVQLGWWILAFRRASRASENAVGSPA